MSFINESFDDPELNEVVHPLSKYAKFLNKENLKYTQKIMKLLDNVSNFVKMDCLLI